MFLLGMDLMIDIHAMIQRETDYYSEEEIKDAITMMFGSNPRLNPGVAQELYVMDIQRKVMDMLRSVSFQEQWTEKKRMKCYAQLGIIESQF